MSLYGRVLEILSSEVWRLWLMLLLLLVLLYGIQYTMRQGILQSNSQATVSTGCIGRALTLARSMMGIAVWRL